MSETNQANKPVPFIDVFNDLNILDAEMMRYPGQEPGGAQADLDGPPPPCSGCGCEQH